MNQAERPQLGEWRTLKATTYKWHENGKTTWEHCPLDAPVLGMYIGCRTVFEGKMENVYEYGDWENPQNILLGRFFFQSKPIEVWLFVIKERQNFVRVFPQDVEIKAD